MSSLTSVTIPYPSFPAMTAPHLPYHRAWQAARPPALPAPVHGLQVPARQGLAGHRQGRGRLPVRLRGQPHPRRHGGPVVREPGLRPARARRGGLPADARAAVLQQLLPDRPPAGDRARQAARGPDAAAVQPRVLHRLGLGGQRHGGAPGAPLLGPAGRAAAQGDHLAGQRLPRQHHGRREPRRHGLHARAGRPADPRHRAHPPALLVRRRAATCRRTSSGSRPRASSSGRSRNSARTAWRPSSASRSRAPAA